MKLAGYSSSNSLQREVRSSFSRLMSRGRSVLDIFAAVQSDGPGRIINTSAELAQAIGYSNQSASGVAVTDATSIRVAAVFACVKLLSESIAMLPVRLYQSNGDRDTIADGHPVDMLLSVAPNSWQTPFEYARMVVGHVLFRGNAYSYKARDKRNNVVELIPLNPSRMVPNLDENLDLTYKYTRPNGNQITFGQADIVHLRGLATDGVVGLGPIQAARNAIALAQVTEQHGSRLFSQGALPTGVLHTEASLSDKAQDNLRKSFEARNTGIENAHKPMILEEGLTWQQMSMSSEDSQFLETRQLQRNEIAMFFGVPPHMIGDIDRGTSWGTGIEQQNLGFLIYSLKPWLVNFQQAYARDLLRPEERGKYIVKHDTSELTRADFGARQTGLAVMKTNGVINANEWRHIEGLNPIPDGDSYQVKAPAPNGDPSQQPEKIPGENKGQPPAQKRAQLRAVASA